MGKYIKNSKQRSRAEEKEMESAYRKLSGSKKKKKKAKKAKSGAAVVAICIAIVAIIIAIAAGCIYFSKTVLNGIILENVSVAGVDVGGMTQAQAIEAVSAKSEAYSNTPMVVKVLDSQTELSTAYLGTLDVRAAVKEAYKFGNSGTQSKREQEQQIALSQGYTVDITKHLNMDTEAIRRALSEFGAQYSSVLTQSTYEVTGEAPNHKLVIKLGVPEYGLDLNALYDKVIDAYNSGVFTVEGECGMIEPDPIDLESILNQYYIAPIDATFDKTTFETIEGTDGYGFDLEKAQEQLEQAKYGTTVEINFAPISPEIDAQKLAATLYKDDLGTYTAISESDSDRDVNLRIACEAINGIILMPGDVFSYNDTLGRRTADKGYRPGEAYSGMQTVYVLGGGICQVASALYYSTLIADLEILSRENHTFASEYVPLGMDAAISWGVKDFRFRNNTEYPLRIDASSDGGSVTVTLVGTDTKDYYIEMEYETLNTYDYSISYRTMSAGNKEGYKNGDYIVKPYTGYDVKTYRCKYSKADNSLISRDFEDSSKYYSRNGIICKIEGEASPGVGGSSVSDAPGALPPE